MTTASLSSTPDAAIQALATELPAALSGLRRGIKRAGEGASVFGPLTGSQAELARLVRHQPGISVATAAAELRLSANTVSTLVGQLTEAGLLVREPDRTDRRVARLRLTEKASAEIRRWHGRQSRQIASALRRLPNTHLRALTAALPALDALVDALEHEAEGTS